MFRIYLQSSTNWEHKCPSQSLIKTSLLSKYPWDQWPSTCLDLGVVTSESKHVFRTITFLFTRTWSELVVFNNYYAMHMDKSFESIPEDIRHRLVSTHLSQNEVKPLISSIYPSICTSRKNACLTGTRIWTKIHLSCQTEILKKTLLSLLQNHHDLPLGALFISTWNVAAREWPEADRRPGSSVFFGRHRCWMKKLMGKPWKLRNWVDSYRYDFQSSYLYILIYWYIICFLWDTLWPLIALTRLFLIALLAPTFHDLDSVHHLSTSTGRKSSRQRWHL